MNLAKAATSFSNRKQCLIAQHVRNGGQVRRFVVRSVTWPSLFQIAVPLVIRCGASGHHAFPPWVFPKVFCVVAALIRTPLMSPT
jgi:hypothetical protein